MYYLHRCLFKYKCNARNFPYLRLSADIDIKRKRKENLGQNFD